VRTAPRRWEVGVHAPLAEYGTVLGRVLAARGLDRESAAAFLDPGASYHDPLLLPDMEHAVAVIRGAVAEGSRIAVYGDYDADGVTACAMLTRVLSSRHAASRASSPSIAERAASTSSRDGRAGCVS